MLRRIFPDAFVILLLATLVCATLLPVRGDAAIWVGWMATAAIVLLFFLHGARLSRSAIVAGALHWKLHAVILTVTFVLFPLLGMGLASAFPSILPTPVWIGIVYLAALPSTVQSSIAFTSIARGNVPAAMAAASASQLLGVLLTPWLVGLMTGVHGGTTSVGSFLPIVLQVLVPFILGHLARPLIGDWISRHRALISFSDRSAILLAVYSAFSAAVIGGLWTRVTPSVLAILGLVLLAMLVMALASTWLIARFLRLEKQDEIVLVFCGTKKSLVQGVPMARVLFPGPELGIVLLPIMIFHQLQLLACSWIARRYARRADDV